VTYLGDASLPRRIARSIAGFFRRPGPSGPPRGPVWVIGHRGAARWAPENTLESFCKALELGADAIETDVCVTRDGRFVLWHDAEPSGSVALVRQVGAEGDFLYLPSLPVLGSDLRRPVSECDEAFFCEHYGYVLAKAGLTLTGTRKPDVPPARLDDLLDWAPREERLAHVFVDVKLGPGQEADAVRLLRLLAQRARRPGHRPGLTIHVLTPQREIASALAEEARRDPPPPGILLTADFELPGVVRTAKKYGIADVSMGLGQRTWGDFRYEVSHVVRARSRGRVASVVVWTLNEEERLRDLVALGVDGIITDDPALLRRLAGSR
jgi:glycerophosphoryl diester phosphodiesterase